jgi:hypothetical protein
MRYIDPTNAIRYPVSPIPILVQAKKRLIKYKQKNLSQKLIEKIRPKVTF